MPSPSGFSFKKIVPKVCKSEVFEDLQLITSNSEMHWAASYDGDSDYKKMSSCAGATIVIKDDGSIWGWGMNHSGATCAGGARLARYQTNYFAGINKNDNSVCCPTQLVAGSWKDVSMSASHAAAVKNDGTLWTWGSTRCGMYGNLGFSFCYHSVSEPTQTVLKGSDWKVASAGHFSTAAIKTDGTLWTWGSTYHGNYSYEGNVDYDYKEPKLLYMQSSGYTATANTETITANVLGAASLTESNDPTYKNTEYWPSDPVILAANGGRNSWWELEIPFNIDYAGTLYNKIFVNSQSYITIGSWPGYVEADTDFRGIGWNYSIFSFNVPKIYLGASANNYCKRIFYGVEGTAPTRTYRVRYETIAGAAWEVTFYEEFPSRIDIQKDGSIPSGYTIVTTEQTYFEELIFSTMTAALSTGGIRIHELSFNADPDSLASISQWKNVSSSKFFNAALKNDGSLWSWGFNLFGETGNLTCLGINSPVQTVAGGTDWKSISVAHAPYNYGAGNLNLFNTIGGIKCDGTLWMWGHNVCGSLGAGLDKSSLCAASSPIQTAAGGTNWKSITVASDSVKAIKCDGSMWTWGTNKCYSNGLCNSLLVRKNKVNGSICSPIPVDIAASKKWKCVQTSFTRLLPGFFSGYYNCNQTIALDYEGNIWGWGMNHHSSLGLGIFPQDRNNICLDSYCRIDKPKLLGEEYIWSANVDIESTDTKISTAAAFPNTCRIALRGKAAIKNDGTLWTWGCNINGRLGDGSTISKSSPVQTVGGGTNWKSISNSSFSASAIKNDGTLWVWGGCANLCTITNFSSPIQMTSGGTNWNQVSEYSTSSILRANIRNDGTLWLSSRSTVTNGGALGNESTVARSSPVQTVSGGSNWKEVCVQSFCNVSAIKTDGTLWTWGRGCFGILGNNNSVNMSSPVQTVSGGTNWRQVTGNCQNTLATKTDGTLWAWGDFDSRGDGCGCYKGYENKSSPVQTFSGGTDWQKVTVTPGRTTVSAIKCDGSLWWWGYGSTFGSGIPQRYGGAKRPRINPYITNIRQASYGAALSENGNLYSWGYNLGGQAGFLCTGLKITTNNNIEYTETLVDLADEFFTKEEFTRSGLWGTGSIRTADNSLGIGCTEDLSKLTQVDSSLCWSKISSYNRASLAVKCDGTLWSWGSNAAGKLGVGDENVRREFTRVGDAYDWCLPRLGFEHAAAIKCDGSLWTWGSSQRGRTGLNTDTNVLIPTLLDNGPWKDLSADNGGSTAIKCDGTLWVWGSCYGGRLGDNGFFGNACISSPVQTIAGGTNWCTISNRYQFAIKTDGTMWTWGFNYYGQLATGDTIARSSPVQTISGGTNWKQVAAYYSHTSAIKTDGTLWGWGNNYKGNLGTGNIEPQSSPVQTVAGGTSWRCLLDNVCNTFAIKNDGTLWGWGYNFSPYAPVAPGSYSVFGTCTSDACVLSPIQMCNGVKGFWKGGSGGLDIAFIGIFESEAGDL